MYTVLHLTGSPTSAFHAELSHLYARACLDTTGDPDRYKTVVADVDPDGTWRLAADLAPASLAEPPPLSLSEAIDRITERDVDVVIPQMFCIAGMTHYRSLFDMLALPYVGNAAATMALTADKAQARAIVAAAGVDVPAGRTVSRGDEWSFDHPVVVKPVDSDNSWGVSLVRRAEDAEDALETAWKHSQRALVETYVPLGREVRCGVLDIDGELTCLPLEEYAVDEASRPIRGRLDKLDRTSDGELQLMAKDGRQAWIVDSDDPCVKAVHDAARGAYRALGCRNYGLFDFRVDPAGRPWFLEASLYCSFAPSSVIVTMADAAGIELSRLFADMIGQALA